MPAPAPDSTLESDSPALPPPFVNGIWIASLYNIDFPPRRGMTPAELQAEIDEMAGNCAAWGVTDIFLQVRPHGDVLYASGVFPWSAELNGTEGVPPGGGFDPLAAWVAAAHERGLQLHAWVNPYRLSVINADSLFAGTRSELVVAHDGVYWLDPGNPGTLGVILAGVEELCRDYDVDGIHFDDYFYPGADFNDAGTFRAYGREATPEAWRIDNVNALIAETRAVTAAYGRQFGVSPSGIWANASAVPAGSDTDGRQSLTDQYADSLAWIQNGWVDYIAPQIYWERGHPKADLNVLLDWWQSAVAGTDVKLYIGLAAYKQADPGVKWPEDELTAQQAMCERADGVDGTVWFHYGAARTLR